MRRNEKTKRERASESSKAAERKGRVGKERTSVIRGVIGEKSSGEKRETRNMSGLTKLPHKLKQQVACFVDG